MLANITEPTDRLSCQRRVALQWSIEMEFILEKSFSAPLAAAARRNWSKSR